MQVGSVGARICETWVWAYNAWGCQREGGVLLIIGVIGSSVGVSSLWCRAHPVNRSAELLIRNRQSGSQQSSSGIFAIFLFDINYGETVMNSI